MHQEIQKTIEKYLEVFPQEKKRLDKVVEQFPLAEDIISRKNFAGHITVSAIVLSEDKRKALFVYHKQLQKLLQPGGHIEVSDQNLLDACRREVREETGLADIEFLDLAGQQLPIDIDIHPIPFNEKKDEAEHFHYDFRFVFIAQESLVVIQEEEVDGFKWIPISEATQYEKFKIIFQKIHFLFDQKKPAIFFDKSERGFYDDLSIFVVTHLLYDRPFFLDALSGIGHIEAIIPKPNSINSEVLKHVQKQFPILQLTREDLRDANVIIPYIKKSKSKVIFLDIGGYFSPIINFLKDTFPEKIIGVIEDTENGYQKYLSLPALNVPVFSVARSPLKDNEDFLVGGSVVFSTDAVFREYNVLFDYLQCGVIGYGKIGKSIAANLQKRNIKLFVHDYVAVKMIEAMNRGCYIVDKKKILEESEVIFCATGNQALLKEDFTQLKNGAFVVSVTSSDDEMDLSILDKTYFQQSVTAYITKYYNDNNYFYLVNKGNAVNFIHDAVIGSFIFLVQAEILLGLEQLYSQKLESGIHEVAMEMREDIAKKWLQVFN